MSPRDDPDQNLQPVPANRVPAFHRTLGMDNLRAGGGRAEIRIALGPQLTNQRGVAHGGVITALLDSVLGAAVVSAIGAEEWCGTVQLNVQFLSPGRGQHLLGRGWMVKRGRAVAFARGEVLDGKGEQVATGEGTWYVWPTRPKA